MNRFLVFPILFMVSSLAKVSGQSTGSQGIDPNTNAVYGKLKNGFTYYIQRDENLKGRIMTKLVVKFGEQDVPESQLEFPHLIEHLGTLKTKNFDSVKGFVEALGLKLGSDFNATTGPKQTNYWMSIFSANPKHLRQALEYYRDVAQGGVIINDATVGTEKLAVLEEYLPNSEVLEPKILNEYLLKLMGPSACTQALLTFHTHDRSTVRNADPKVLKELYDTWYRPDTEAIIVTGDVDVNKVEKEIVKMFSNLKSSDKPLKRPDCPAVTIPQTSYSLVTNSQVAEPEIRVMSRSRSLSIHSPSDVEKAAVKRLVDMLVTNRLSKLKLSPSRLSLVSVLNGYGSPFAMMTTYVTADNPQNLKPAFIRMQTEIERMQRYGFTESEIKTAKENVIKEMELNFSVPSSLSDKYFSHFLEGTAVLPKQAELDLTTQKLSQIDHAQISNEVKFLLNNPDRHIVVIGAKDAGLPDERTVLSWLDSVKSMNIEPLREEKLLTRLSELIPVPLANVSPEKATVQLTEIGVTKLTLANGITVLCKPVPPANADEKDMIYLGAIKPYRSTHTPSTIAEIATGVISGSGVGSYSGEAWNRYKQQQHFSVNPFILDNRAGFNGRGNMQAITDMLLSIHAYFTGPKVDPAEFESSVAGQRKQLLAKRVPVELYIDAGKERTAIQSSMYTKPNAGLLDTLSKSFILDLYRNEFYNPSEFTFVITGDFKVESIKEKLNFYLGTIPVLRPSSGGQASHTELKSLRDTTLYTGQSGKGAKLTLQYFTPVAYNFQSQVELEVISSLLNSVVFSTIRERDGLAYMPGAYGYFSEENLGLTAINASLDCDKNNLQQASSTLKKEIMLALSNPDTHQLQTAKLSVLTNYEKGANNPMFWKAYLVRQLLYQNDLTSIAKVKAVIETIDLAKIKKLSGKILKEGHSRQIVLVPGGEGVTN